MEIRKLHNWDISISEAKSVQERLRGKVELKPLRLGDIRHVAGADIAVSKKLDRLVAAVVVMTFPGLEVVEIRTAAARPPFPYIPGYLSFREIPVLINCLETVSTPFDVILCDGQGIAHPRFFGLASHLGLMINLPAVGCAKTRLVGDFSDVGDQRGDYSRLMFKSKQVGSVLRTRNTVKPIFVSPGFHVDFPSSRRIVLACLRQFRLPEPTRLAHIEAGKQKTREESSATE